MQTESRTWVVGAGEGEGRPACHGAQFQWEMDGGDNCTTKRMYLTWHNHLERVTMGNFLLELHTTIKQCFKSVHRGSGCSKRNKPGNSV